MSVPISLGRLWVLWAIGSTLSLFVVGAMVFYAGQHGAWLLGWAIGMVISALLIIFRRRA
jgi:hypothetical protein